MHLITSLLHKVNKSSCFFYSDYAIFHIRKKLSDPLITQTSPPKFLLPPILQVKKGVHVMPSCLTRFQCNNIINLQKGVACFCLWEEHAQNPLCLLWKICRKHQTRNHLGSSHSWSKDKWQTQCTKRKVCSKINKKKNINHACSLQETIITQTSLL